MDIGLTTVVNVAFSVYSWLIFARIILSWLRPNPYQPVIRFIYEVTEPFLSFFRRFIPPVGMIDFSPVVAFFALEVARRVLLELLRGLGIS